jgi:hypothetical protein
LRLDDAFIILSACCLAGGLAIQQHMWNMGMAEIPKASRDNYIEMMKVRTAVSTIAYFSDSMQMILPGSILYVSSVWAIKIALVILYKHIAAPGTKLQIIYNVTIGVLVTTYLVIFFHIIFQCYPQNKRWSQDLLCQSCRNAVSPASFTDDPLDQCKPENAEINYWITVTSMLLITTWL